MAGRLHGLRDYEFMDDAARNAFSELTDELRQQMLQTYFQGLKEGVERVTPEDLAGIREMVRDLNALLEKHADRGRYDRRLRRASWRSTGSTSRPGSRNIDELIEHLHRQASQMASLLNSMSPEMRDELRSMMDDLLRDDRLQIDMARLAGNLQMARPDLPFGEPYPFEGDEPMGLADALAAIDRQQQYDAMEEALGAARDPDALERVDADALRDLAGDDAIDDLRAAAGAHPRRSSEAGYLDRDGGRLELTPRAARKLGMRALTDIFSRLRREGFGGHAIPRAGRGGEPTEETKRYEFGDPFAVDINRTLFNAMATRRAGTPVIIGPGRLRGLALGRDDGLLDGAAARHEPLDAAAWLLIGGQEGRDGPPYPHPHEVPARSALRGRVRVLRAPAEAGVDPDAVSPYEFEYGTNLQHALIIARQLLGRSHGGNKEIVVITDGEPTAHIDNGQVEFAYPPTLRTVQSTLREVGRCTREGIVINTFMLERSRYLSEFVDLMSRINRGRAFYVEPEHLGEYVLVDYVNKKTKRVA